MTNPLLAQNYLPLFDQIKPEHLEDAVNTLLENAYAALNKVTQADFPANWQALSLHLGVPQERLSVAWSAVGHIKSVLDTPALREAYNTQYPRVLDFYNRVSSSEPLFQKYRAINPQTLNIEEAQARLYILRDFELSGAALNASDKKAYLALQEEMGLLQQKYGENLLDATDAFALYVACDELDGVPDDVKTATRQSAQKEGKQGYRLSLQMPCYLPVMQFATNRSIREKLYRAYVTRASDIFDTSDNKARTRDNTPIIKSILKLRQKEATLLGYANFAEASLVPKMATSSTAVIDFLRDLKQKSHPYAKKDIEEIKHFAKNTLGLTQPEAWDLLYIREKIKETRYAYNEQEIKPFFSLDRVLSGLFSLCETLFNIRISKDSAPIWHPDVQFFKIERKNANGQFALISQFYLDPSARSGKSGGAWMADVRSRWLRPDTGKLQTPVAHLVCNFSSGHNGKPALLSHDDVMTLFHEFGHGLHHMLTQVNEISIAGISGVEWDAVELPSQFMENFCWDWQVLQRISHHVDTGEKLPQALFDKMLAAKNHQSGMQTVHQIELALFDMLIHCPTDGNDSSDNFLSILKKVRTEVAVFDAPEWNRIPHSFSHIFNGGYSVGYYSYKWAEVLSADAYAAFEETKNTDGSYHLATCERYLKNILEKGASRPALDSFIAFRGRKPTPAALMRHLGLVDSRTPAI